MSARWRKAVRDLWSERTRTALVVLAVALGLAGFTAVMSSYAILTRELNAGYLATNPASFTLETDRADDALLAAVRATPGAGEVEARRSLSGRVKTGPAEWRNLVLFVVKDYGDVRVSTLSPERGAWPPGPGEILIERDALRVARADVGDDVMVRTSKGVERTLRVSGSVHDVGQAQARMENLVYGYVTLETLAALGEEPYLDEVKVVVSGDRFDVAHVREVAEAVRRTVEGLGRPVRDLAIPAPGEHPHARIMGLLLLAIASFGFFILLLSGVIVVNLMTALMAAQVRQIGVMKAVGGSRRQIAAIYLGQALLMGAAAVAVALPAGLVGGRALCRAMAVFLNFDVTSFAVPAWVFALVALVGLAVPLLAAAIPVWRGTGVSVREALADFGVSPRSFGASAFDRAVAGVGGPARPLLLALRNAFRRRTRVALTVATLVAGGLFFMSALNVRSSMIATLDRLFAQRRFDLSVSLGATSPRDAVERAARSTPGVSAAEGWILDGGSIPRGDDAPGAAGGLHAVDADRFGVVGLPADSKLLAMNFVAGSGLAPGDEDAVVLNTALAAKLGGTGVGDVVTLRVGDDLATLRIAGVSREPFSPAVAYLPLGYFDRHGKAGVTNSVRLALEKTDPASVSAVRADLDRNLDREGVRAVGSSTKADSRYGFDQHMVMIYVFLVIVSCVLGGVGGLGLATTMSLNVLERRREMGVLRAIGATPGFVGLIVVSEGVAIGLTSWALAALAAWPVSKAIGNFLLRMMFGGELDFAFEPSGLAIWLVVTLALAGAASFLPAWHAGRRPVREAIGYE